jgi:hypothetical protein
VAQPCLRTELAAVLAVEELHCCKLGGGEVHVGVKMIQMLSEVGTVAEACRALGYCAWLHVLIRAFSPRAKRWGQGWVVGQMRSRARWVSGQGAGSVR